MTSFGTPSEEASGAPTGAAENAFSIRLSALEHDMRTPVGTLSTALKVMRMGHDARTCDALDVADRQIRLLAAHLQQLHDLCCEIAAAQSSRR